MVHANAASASAASSARRRRSTRAAALLALPAVAAVGSLLALIAASYAPGALGQAYLPPTMIDAMESAMFLTKYMDAADVTGYYDRFLEEDFSGTVFAPVDLGFDALLTKLNATWEELTSAELNATLSGIVGLHVVPGVRLFPLTALKDGLALDAASGGKLYIRRDVPGIVHVYPVPRPEDDPLNFATVLQYQEIRGGKAILYVVDKVLLPPAKTSAPAPAATSTTVGRRSRGGAGAPNRKALF
ncbi:hypothetical protein GPECTOR_6g755 [Gonium pectorale]|uniref:FAS1 domain-containing protein n=1 Tax=Gonium pectorale TaxID=33097 RepID=A0A150GVD0_GONPE|nr:hypothetical protein GPECTOR_6g755 [Gonium pectorale]|eukprot:KXZ53837.1 hypothetical protein GPECTOR_6g755 [Gonium pectorale]